MFPFDLFISQVRLKVDPDWKTKNLTKGRIIGLEFSAWHIFAIQSKTKDHPLYFFIAFLNHLKIKVAKKLFENFMLFNNILIL